MTMIAGMFDSTDSAERAKAELARVGIEDHRVTLSINLTQDPIGAENPGQSYENQDDGSSDRDAARYAEAVRSAVCVLTVRVDDGLDQEQVAAILHRQGARRAIARP